MSAASKLVLGAFVISSLIACSSGGGSGGSASGDISGLTMPNKLSVVAAKSAASAKVEGIELPYKAISRTVATSAISGFSATADYNADQTRTHVWDPSIEPLNTVNMILCLMDQTKAADMVNQGPYIALVNEAKCDQGKNQSGAAQGGAQTGSSGQSAQMVKYNKWTIESTRTDSASPQYVRIWVPGGANNNGSTDPRDNQNILVQLTVNESVSGTKPFGNFVLNFRGEMSDGTAVMNGTLMTVENSNGKPEFSYYSEGGTNLAFGQQEQTHVVLDDASGNSGYANIGSHYWDNGGAYDQQSAFAIAFNDNYFLRSDGTNQACADRNSFKTHVWQYNLYHAANGTYNGKAVTAGQRVKLNSSVPITFTRNGKTLFGNVGYWGSWTEDNQGLTDDMTVTRDTWGNGPGESYTVKVSAGKLHRRTRETATFADVKGADFYWYGDPNNLGNWSEYLVQVNAAGTSFEAVATVAWDQNTGQRSSTPLATPVTLNLANNWDQFWLWSDSLGGNVVYKYALGTTTPELIFYREEVVSPNDAAFANGPLTLTCYDRCLKAGVPGTATQESDLFSFANYTGTGVPTAYSYSVTPVTGGFRLTTGGTEVTLPTGLDLTTFMGGSYQWGVQSGEMVTANVAAALNNWWELYDAQVSYRWETGPNDWNRQFALLNASNEIVTFDKPLQFNYAFAAGDDPNYSAALTTHPAGNKFLLEYGGPGQLWGFPWYDDNSGRSWATLTLNNGVELTDAGGAKYVVKAMEREQTMNLAADPAACSTAGLNLTNPNALALPTANTGNVAFTWNDQLALTVDTAPAVVGGELQQ